jgi:hypothetical protein
MIARLDELRELVEQTPATGRRPGKPKRSSSNFFMSLIVLPAYASMTDLEHKTDRVNELVRRGLLDERTHTKTHVNNLDRALERQRARLSKLPRKS